MVNETLFKPWDKQFLEGIKFANNSETVKIPKVELRKYIYLDNFKYDLHDYIDLKIEGSWCDLHHIIINKPAVVVKTNSGKTYTSVAQKGEPFDVEKGFAIALNKFYKDGNELELTNTQYHKLMKKVKLIAGVVEF